MDVINAWFRRAAKEDGDMGSELRLDQVADFLVDIGLVSDKDTGIKQIVKSLRLRDRSTLINWADFQKLFCRSIFKFSLIEVLHEIEGDHVD